MTREGNQMNDSFQLTKAHDPGYFRQNYLEVYEGKIVPNANPRGTYFYYLFYYKNHQQELKTLSAQIENIFVEQDNYTTYTVSTQLKILNNLHLISLFQTCHSDDSDKKIQGLITTMVFNLFNKIFEDIKKVQKDSLNEMMSKTTEYLKYLQDLTPYKKRLNEKYLNVKKQIRQFVQESVEFIDKGLKASVTEIGLHKMNREEWGVLYKALNNFLNKNENVLTRDQKLTLEAHHRFIETRLEPRMILNHIENSVNKLGKIQLYIRDIRMQELAQRDMEERINNVIKTHIEPEIKNTEKELNELLTTQKVFDNWSLTDCYGLYANTCGFVYKHKEYMNEHVLNGFKLNIYAMKVHIKQKRVPKLIDILFTASQKIVPYYSDAKKDLDNIIENAAKQQQKYPSEKFTKEELNFYLKELDEWIVKTIISLKEYLSGSSSLYKQEALEELFDVFSSLSTAEKIYDLFPKSEEKQPPKTMIEDVKEVLNKNSSDNNKNAMKILTKLYNDVNIICKGLEATSIELLNFRRSLNYLLIQLNGKQVKYPCEIQLPFDGPVLTISNELELNELLSDENLENSVNKIRSYIIEITNSLLEPLAKIADVICS